MSLSTAGAMTGIAFAHGTLADMTSPTSIPAHLLAVSNAARPASAGDGALRSAIVSAAKYYLGLAQQRTPAQMEALIWQQASTDGADHGESCAAFASLTLQAGAQASGQQSWVTGGTSYPWPLHAWADVRVDPNPDSPGIVSMLQDAEAHHRWHPLGDGYTPQPGDWVMFAGHVEVVTSYTHGVLYTIGGDSLPNLSVNAHQYADPLGAQGVTGFIDNGQLLSAEHPSAAAPASPSSPQPDSGGAGGADIPGALAASGVITGGPAASGTPTSAADPAAAAQPVLLGVAAIPGVQASGGGSAGQASHRYSRHQAAPSPAQAPATSVKQEFINEVAPGAVAAQRQYGVPAAVTIAQAIDESGWGQSQLATQDNNLFGIKGTGPAGSVTMPAQEYVNGQWVTVSAPFRVYASVAQSIADHTLLLATGSSYKQAMADRADPDAFANDLTGVYATDPSYGANLITIMRLYNLYRYGAGTQAAPPTAARPSARASAVSSGAVLGGFGNGATGLNQALQSASSESAAIPGLAAQGRADVGPGGGGVAATAVAGSGPAARSTAGRSTAGRSTAGSGTVRTSAAGRRATRQSGSGAGVTRMRSGEGGPVRSAVRATDERATAAQDRIARVRETTARLSEGHRGAASAVTAGTGQRPARTSAPSTIAAAAGGGTVTRTARATAAATGASKPSSTGATARAGRALLPSAARSAIQAKPTSSGIVSGGGGQASGGAAGQGGTRIPGLLSSYSAAAPLLGSVTALRAGPRNARISTRRYVPQIPNAVTTAFIATAKTPLLRQEQLYRDVVSETGMRWQLLAACDWMQCRAHRQVSPVFGEKLGTRNEDGTVYRSKSQALGQCASDLVDLARAVYGIDLTERLFLSVRDLASVFAAFRWGGLLAAHHISAMEFPYSVQGLTAQHMKMRWPDIPDTPKSDKPGARFQMGFGAVTVVLGLDYPAVA